MPTVLSSALNSSQTALISSQPALIGWQHAHGSLICSELPTTYQLLASSNCLSARYHQFSASSQQNIPGTYLILLSYAHGSELALISSLPALIVYLPALVSSQPALVNSLPALVSSQPALISSQPADNWPELASVLSFLLAPAPHSNW